MSIKPLSYQGFSLDFLVAGLTERKKEKGLEISWHVELVPNRYVFRLYLATNSGGKCLVCENSGKWREFAAVCLKTSANRSVCFNQLLTRLR